MAANKKAKSFYKLYWSEDLQHQWDIVCETEKLWLTCSAPQKRNFRDAFTIERKKFDKMNRKAKRAYQLTEQTRLGDLCDSRNFWKEIGKVGLQNVRKVDISMEVTDEQGNIATDTQSVLSRCKNDYATLFSEDSSDLFNDEYLQRIKLCLENNTVPSVNRDTSDLNCPITFQEVLNLAFAKLNLKARLVSTIFLHLCCAMKAVSKRCIP